MCAPGFELWHHSGEANSEGRAAMKSLIPSPPSVLKAAQPASHHIPSRECVAAPRLMALSHCSCPACSDPIAAPPPPLPAA